MPAPALLIVGAGGFGRSVAEAAEASGAFRVGGFIDDRGPELGLVLGRPVLGRLLDLEGLRGNFQQLVVAVGDNARRRELCVQLRAAGFDLATVVHPRAWISAHASVGAGSMVMAAAVVGTEARIGEGVIVNCGAVVDHHALVGDFAHLEVGSCLGGGGRLAELQRLAPNEPAKNP